MTCDIFIKSYKQDFPWLKYCLISIARFCTGFEKTWLVVDSCDAPEIEGWGLTSEHLVTVEPKKPGYLHQQYCKLNADKWSTADYIMFVDSDCIFRSPVTPADFFDGERPVLLKTRYSSLPTGFPWQPVTEKALGFPCEWETMRRLPMIFPRRLLGMLREHIEHIHKMSMEDYILTSGSFSEFNALGSLAHKKYPEMFRWQDTEMEPLPKTVLLQYYSHGGITAAIQSEIENALRNDSSVLKSL